MILFQKEDFIICGKVLKPHGHKGVIKIWLKHEVDLDEKKFLFLSLLDKPVPFLIESSEQISNDTYLVKLEDINSPEAAQKYIETPILIDKAEIRENNLGIEINSLEGFNVLDQDGKTVGSIVNLQENAGQFILKLVQDNMEYLIPLHEDLVIKIDEDARVLQLQIADGLLELFKS